MTQTADIAGAGTVARTYHHGPFGLLKELDRPGDVFRNLGPNWFAAVMGTGIVANAGAVLSLRLPGLRGFATAMWALAAGVLIALIAAWSVHWIRYPERAVVIRPRDRSCPGDVRCLRHGSSLAAGHARR